MGNTLPENNFGGELVPKLATIPPGYTSYDSVWMKGTSTIPNDLTYDSFDQPGGIVTAATGPRAANFWAGNLGYHSDYSLTGPCATHKTAWNTGKFRRVKSVFSDQLIWAAEINSLKWALRNIGTFWNQSGKGQIPTIIPTFATKLRGNVISKAEWNEIRAALAGFNGTVGVVGAGALKNRKTSDMISAEFHEELIEVYDSIRATCRCNSDCGCNQVCSCHYNCGCHYSDRRLKENVRAITGTTASELIYNLNTYSYNYIKDNNRLLPTDTVQYGVMAQDLIELGYEEFISTDSDGVYSVNYTMMIPLMINEMQKTRRTNQDLEDRVSKLEELVNKINSNYKSY